MSAERVDVLCVGLGPAGARAAAASASHGCRVIAVDRRREAGLPVQCAEFVPAMVGIEVPTLAPCVRQSIAAMDTFVEEERPDRTAPFPGRMLDRAAFDARLVAEAIAAGADCRFAVSVRAIERDATAVLSSGERIRPRVLVGADGPRSIVGRAIGQANTALVETRQITVALRVPHDATDIFLSASIPGGYGWLFPKGDVANVGAGVDPVHASALKSIVAALHARLVEEGRVGRAILALTGGAIPVGGPREASGLLAGTFVLLAGDAAGLAHPVTGAGIAAAVQSGTLAGDAAALLVAGDDDAAQAYREELDALFGAALARGVRRREELLHARPTAAALRRGWIAYPEYWTQGAPS